MKLGYQFTSDQKHEFDCQEWFEWFESRGVPAAVIQILNGFFVFRKGTVMQKTKDGKHQAVPIEDSPVKNAPYKILKKCNGYMP